MDYEIEQNINEYVKIYAERILADVDSYVVAEGYKYNAVATFQREFNLDSKDTPEMLKNSFKDGFNLVNSGQYFPAEMLIRFATKNPKIVRALLAKLLDNNNLVTERIDNFINDIKENFPLDRESYFIDARFLSFLLAANNPEKYFYVKTRQFVRFSSMIGFDLKVKGSQGEKYRQMAGFAKIIRDVLIQNSDFNHVHKIITNKFKYKDSSLSWGIIDFIYNVVERTDSLLEREVEKKISFNERIKRVKKETLDDLIMKEEVVPEILNKSIEELLKEAKKFKPSAKEDYKEEVKNQKVRRDNVKQKERIKKIENYTCQVCGYSFEYKNAEGEMRKYAEVDHIVEKSKGGTETVGNLWVLCANCHMKKTLGVITINRDTLEVKDDGKLINIRNNHLE